ncbi:MAG: hypothetical protein MAG431_00602 [Chloroflexi bacterium]|nr:hypothetical protein [Chloroflexota bacterium]
MNYINLSKHDRQAVQALLAALERQVGDQILRVVLFGSKARGDDLPDSDIDVLVLTTDASWSLENRILTLGARCSLEHDVLFNLYVLSEKRWDWMEEIRHPLMRTMTRDGLELPRVAGEAAL